MKREAWASVQHGLNRRSVKSGHRFNTVYNGKEKINSRGIIAKAGRYGGTYAHKDIAFEFATWVSPQFKLYLIQEFERMKSDEQKQLGWTAKRELSKINYPMLPSMNSFAWQIWRTSMLFS